VFIEEPGVASPRPRAGAEVATVTPETEGGLIVHPQEFFSPVAFDYLWEAMGIGELPYPLQVRSHGATEDERIALRNRVHTELKARGIRDVYGQLEPHVGEWLVTLARPVLSVDALHIPEFQAPPVGVLAASDGKNGVVAVQDANGIWIRPIPSDSLVSTVVDLLPAAKRGTEAAITLPLQDALHTPPIRGAVPASVGGKEENDKQGKGKRQKAPQPTRTPLSERVNTDPRRAYGQLAGQPRLRGGQLAANSRSSLGGRQRSPVLAWFDTATGRYLSLTRAGTDGREWVTISSADAKTLRTRLGEMVAEVAGDTR
jgi:hypothetical protein